MASLLFLAPLLLLVSLIPFLLQVSLLLLASFSFLKITLLPATLLFLAFLLLLVSNAVACVPAVLAFLLSVSSVHAVAGVPAIELTLKSCTIRLWLSD